MSYDLAVFDPRTELRDRKTFLKWYRSRTRWLDGLDYNEPANATLPLRAWFQDMIAVFPPLNGPLRPPLEDEDRRAWAVDYSICADLIYMAFPPSKGFFAYERVTALAAKHAVGFFDVSGDGSAWFPGPAGGLELLHAPERRELPAAPRDLAADLASAMDALIKRWTR